MMEKLNANSEGTDYQLRGIWSNIGALAEYGSPKFQINENYSI